jgi:hypothetical protein
MKNIHVLPTNKPSRLISCGKEFTLLKKVTVDKRCKHIYITSDEKPKVGDWVYCIVNDMILTDGEKTSRVCLATKTNIDWSYKIILTTDQDLIKNGVQAIDNEFLEWFVKNSICEFVEVKLKQHFEADKSKRINPLNGVYYLYKIIIPEEKSKQETVEEAAERLSERHHYAFGQQSEFYQLGFIEGAEWQAERIYSKEDLKEAFKQGQKYENFDCQYAFNEWFEQFKKNK